MTAAERVADALDAVGDAAEGVVETNYDVADIIRDAPSRGLGLALGAFLLGAGLGGGLGFLLTRGRLEAKYAKIADDEIAVMKEHYVLKAKAFESEVGKGNLETIVQERGYAVPTSGAHEGPPLAVQPPEAVMESEDDKAGEATEADDEPEQPPVHRNIFRDRPKYTDRWDYNEEKRRRTPDIPYVIHYDERHEFDYSEVTLTYYEGDDVLCDADDDVIDQNTRDRLIGEDNLMKFGHGSNDPDIVFIRNDELEIMYEVVKSPNHYGQEVHGLDMSHGDHIRGNLERMRRRERDENEG